MLAPVPGRNGQPIGWVTPGPDGEPDSILAATLTRYLAREAAAEKQREWLRENGQTDHLERISISDRH